MQKFNNPRYATRGISSTLPLMLQIILWGLIDTMEVVEKDYLQIFTLASENGKQKIVHEQEQPEYRMEYLFPADEQVNAKSSSLMTKPIPPCFWQKNTD